MTVTETDIPHLRRTLARMSTPPHGHHPDPALSPLAELTVRWSDGWIRSRRAAPATRTPWGLSIDVGSPRELRRHLLLDPDPAQVAHLAAAIHEPRTWIKAAAATETLRPVLGTQWTDDAPVFLMTWDVRPLPIRVPTGYTLHTSTGDDVTQATILAADGTVAAHARHGHAGDHGSPDQVSTDPAHQRRGLGTILMSALANAAHQAGESVSILAASIPGRALYETLGWQTVSPLAGFFYQP
jgi:GNAT superfamily N-acetyltransferase